MRGSLMSGTPRQWERSLASSWTRCKGRLPNKDRLRRITPLLRRCHQLLWSAYDQRP